MAKMTLKEVQAAIRKLSPEDKEILIKDLLSSESDLRPDAVKEWVAESKRRYKDIVNGEVETIPAEDVFEKIKKARATGSSVSSLLRKGTR